MKLPDFMNPSRTFLQLLCSVLFVILLSLQLGSAQSALPECQGGFTYLVEADTGGYYALVGLPSSLRSEYGNHTARISVNGTYYPSNPSEYLHPDPNFRGLIYVSQYVIVSGTSTATFTNSNQISPTTITMATAQITLAPIGVAGRLDYSNGYCVTPVLTATSTGSTGGNPTQPIPGFTTLSIILGLVIGVSIVALAKPRRGRTGSEMF
jgi:hypothetical protein